MSYKETIISKKSFYNEDSNSINLEYAILKNDIIKLRKYGAQGHGFKNNNLRKKIWNILICPENENFDIKTQWNLLPIHKDENQVQLDVNRSFIYYPKSKKYILLVKPNIQRDLDHIKLKKKKNELKSLIVEILRKHPNLNYFQGFHDIAQVFLLCAGKKKAAKLLEFLSLTRIRDFFLPSLSPVLNHLEFIKSIILKEDEKLGKHIENIPSHFALATYLTWFSHEAEHLEDVLKLFDFILATDTIMILYIHATIILQQKEKILSIAEEETDIIYKVLSDLIKKCPTKDIFQKTIFLREKIQPHTLPSWKYILNYSCIRDFESRYHLKYATELYLLEIDELKKSKSYQHIFNKNKINSLLFIVTLAIFSISITWYKNFIKNI
ncbi:hypothetical protein PCK1_001994 [Pneumocystis canis]|nr:hypothetical protein PCK1_001994 [Pneumocystis canis]